MVDWPEITVVIITFEREKELTETIERHADNLRYPFEKLSWLICDDCSPSHFAKRLAKRSAFKRLNIQVVETEQNGGWGKNTNWGLSHVKTPYVFQVEDDKRLYKPLDLCVGVALMEVHPDIGYLRYRGTAGDHTIFHQFEADISPFCPDYQDGSCGLPGHLTYLQLDSGSPTLWLYTHGPHLKHSRFHQFYGQYPEGLKLGPTEESYCHTVKNGMKQPGAPALVILPDWVTPHYEDFGQSFQGSEWDK